MSHHSKEASLKAFGLSALGGAGLYGLMERLRPGYGREKMPPPLKVSSSTIDAVSYNPVSKELVVIFKTGKKYKYDGVSKRKFESFISSPSKNGYLRSKIAPRHQYEKLATAVRAPLETKKPKSLSQMLEDLRHIDTPEKWKAYMENERTGAHNDLKRTLHDSE